MFVSITHATPVCDGSWLVFTANPDGTPLVAIGSVTVPGAMFVAWEFAVAAVSRNTLGGKFVPEKLTMAAMVSPPFEMICPVLTVFDGFLSMRKRPSPWVPPFAVGFTNSEVDPVVHPVAHVP